MSGVTELGSFPVVRPTEQQSPPRKPEPERKEPSNLGAKALDEEGIVPASSTEILKSENVFDQLASELVGKNASLRISQDDATGRFLYSSVDKVSGEVIDQWPAEEFIRKLAFFLEVNPDQHGANGQAVDQQV